MDNEDSSVQHMEIEQLIELESHVGMEFPALGDRERNTGQDVVAPHVGMEFPTLEAAYEFYNAYARTTGFGIRRCSSNTSRKGKEVISKIFVCNKEGWKKKGDTQRSTRNGCKARLKILRSKLETWNVSQFVKDHNSHELTSPSKVMKHRSHNHLHRSNNVKNLISGLHDEGFGPSNIAKAVNMLSGSQDEVVTPQQVQTQLRVARKNNIGRECVQVIKHFQNRKNSDPDFYFTVELDTDQTLRSVFWADGRSRISYLQFSDVVVFDVTYKTNKFNLPFAPFTGVNHHRQSCLFGCALLADEKEETFVWLFQEWLKCMWDKAPGAIITDQDHAICNAIARVFPQTRHRYCKWHLEKHISTEMVHLKKFYGQSIGVEFNKLENSNNTIEAESIWKEMEQKYNFEKTSWISKLWSNRHHWIPCYLKDVFLAGMTTSQRSESMNSFFDNYIHSKTPLTEFVTEYDKAVAHRRAAEEHEDFKTLNSSANMIWKNNMEEQAGECYTAIMFKIFQNELLEGALYWSERVSKEATGHMYLVGPSKATQSKMRLVKFDASDSVSVSCECGKFEMEGMLCSHALYILNKKRVLRIPDTYILDRWMIKARFRVSNLGSSDVAYDVRNVNQLMAFTVRSKFNKVFEVGCKSVVILKRLDSYLSNELVEIENQMKANEVEDPSSHAILSGYDTNTIQLTPEITIRDPSEPRIGKGRPKEATRIKGGLEQAQDKSQKRKRTCSFCGEKGHNRNGCHKAKAARAPNCSSSE